MQPVLEQMDSLSERHPYGDVLRFRAEIALGSGETGRQGLRKLAEAHPDDPVIALAWVRACMDAVDLDEAERCCTRLLEPFWALFCCSVSINLSLRTRPQPGVVTEGNTLECNPQTISGRNGWFSP